MNKDEMKNRISLALKDPILQQGFEIICKNLVDLEKENAELRKVAEFQQSSNMDTHLENKKLKETLTVCTTWNKHLNSRNKALEEESDKYRNMVFDKIEQIDKAKGIIKDYMIIVEGDHTTVCSVPEENRCINVLKLNEKAKQFLRDVDRW